MDIGKDIVKVHHETVVSVNTNKEKLDQSHDESLVVGVYLSVIYHDH